MRSTSLCVCALTQCSRGSGGRSTLSTVAPVLLCVSHRADVAVAMRESHMEAKEGASFASRAPTATIERGARAPCSRDKSHLGH